MPLPTIPVIIPAYRQPRQLQQCLTHLRRQTQPVDIFVRDNNEDNVYFTAAINDGIRRFLATNCPAMLLLNQDMYLAADAVEQLWRFLQAHPRCGVASPIEAIKDHPQQLAVGGGLESFPFGRHRLAAVADLRHDERLHWARGVCLLLRRELIEEIGLLDRNLVFLCSDVDYCLSARERGWQVWRVGAALGEHETGGASGKDSGNPALELIKIKDAVFFAKKWLTGELYRKLSYDGEALTPALVAAGMRRLRGEPEPASHGVTPHVAGEPSTAHGYYQQPRPEVMALISPDAQVILDIGCGAGALGAQLKARQACHVSGIEGVQAVAELATEVLDTVHAGDIPAILPTLPNAQFDSIIMADVLEHLIDTEQVLSEVHRILQADGELILSVPNVGHWSVLQDLLQGRWAYQEQGILDRTHLRFFTRGSLLAALAQQGFEAVRIEATTLREPPPDAWMAALRALGLDGSAVARDSQCFQYLLKARKRQAILRSA
jgi:GT2 family glycosyltransferase/2-polyprenyl-3-methyl-5-hydroxy-6-metoxy-1,4-benzoquinol methylase